jgi:hypothetical protein
MWIFSISQGLAQGIGLDTINGDDVDLAEAVAPVCGDWY